MLVTLMITVVIGITVVDSINEQLAEMPATTTCCAAPDFTVLAVPLVLVFFMGVAGPISSFIIEFLENA